MLKNTGLKNEQTVDPWAGRRVRPGIQGIERMLFSYRVLDYMRRYRKEDILLLKRNDLRTEKEEET